MFKSSLKIGLITLIAVLSRFILNYLYSYYVKDVSELDIYFSALTVPSYLVNVIGGTLSAVIIPQIGIIEDLSIRWKKFNALFVFFCIIALLASISTALFSEEIISLLLSGYSAGKKFEITKLLIILSVTIFLNVINSLIPMYFYISGRYVYPALVGVIPVVLMIIGVVIIGQELNGLCMAVILVFSSLLQTFLYILNWKAREFHYSCSIIYDFSLLRRVLLALTPLVLATIATRFNNVYDKTVLSNANDGVLATYSISNKVYLVVYQILSSLFATQVLAEFTKLKKDGNEVRVKEWANKGFTLIFWIVVPILVLGISLSENVLTFMYSTTKFNPEEVKLLVDFFVLFIPLIPGLLIGKFLTNYFYIFEKTKFILIVAILESILFIISILLFKDTVGIKSLFIALYIQAYFSIAFMSIALRKTISWDLKSIFGSIFMAIMIFLVYFGVLDLNGSIFLALFSAITVYIISFLIFKPVELTNILKIVKAKILKTNGK
jgi:putative peptidoglycan lipid II flippase